ncbi:MULTISPECIES: GNAT family N-acetyltransferase [Streptomyces]|uniref:GNAT family N-acetyltransferase n=1 Tax=Streptomyces rhizosphaericola TaxID=2564098 RepID=A0ABY2PE51_9ACTN|nr:MULTISPECIES: GNAT family N-acetyltransferase [Streptomyces]ARI52354.1 acetyltransferase [Streptomyces sp. S8]MYT97651.1 GNAT family N-acetyltransferase [Streptomyces sp. SID8350]NGO86672.1 GNAT family N-acetyltransferase [Streptomyces sp. 196(2019)]TGZ09305.1 GNAT family N-acetyltransferase [Streptomyces rhizosphaericola]SCK16196.1 Acetyltransferases [Streptomyces sp. AmelKG-D3]
MDLTIRVAEPAEYAVLGEIIAEAYLGDGLLDGPADPYLLKLRAVEQRAAEAEVLVALDADGVVLGGVTYAAPGTPWRDISGPDEAEFRMLAVARAGRGRGVGEALVRACVERARSAEGVRGLVLSTQPAMLPAHRIYRRLGFLRTPERDWEPVPGLRLMTFRLELETAS